MIAEELIRTAVNQNYDLGRAVQISMRHAPARASKIRAVSKYGRLSRHHCYALPKEWLSGELPNGAQRNSASVLCY